MAEYQMDKNEVHIFLDKVKSLASDKTKVFINTIPWKGNKVNKTLAYMAETGIGIEDIIKILYELQITNYSYTADDRNINFKDELVWIFGICKNIIDTDVDLYIKLKIKSTDKDTLLILSFHPEKPGCNGHKLVFPYAE